jgi:hypothetical protein
MPPSVVSEAQLYRDGDHRDQYDEPYRNQGKRVTGRHGLAPQTHTLVDGI